MLVASLLAPLTFTVAVVPKVQVTHLEPFHISKALATIDHLSAWRGAPRAGWVVDVDTTDAAAEIVGLRPAPSPDEAWEEAAEVADVVQRLWDSWEADAEIRDVATGRFIDRDKLHYVDFEGRHFSVKGPSITPAPPQRQPVTFVAAGVDTAPVQEFADILLVDEDTVETTTDGRRTVLDLTVDPDRPLLEQLPVGHPHAGLNLRAEDPFALLDLLVDSAAELQTAGLATGSALSLRQRFGLPPAVNRYVENHSITA